MKAALDQANISGRQAAERIGMPHATFSRKLRGHSPFTATELHNLGVLLGIRGSDLMAEAEAAVA